MTEFRYQKLLTSEGSTPTAREFQDLINLLCRHWRISYRTLYNQDYLITMRERKHIKDMCQTYTDKAVKKAMTVFLEGLFKSDIKRAEPTIASMYFHRKSLFAKKDDSEKNDLSSYFGGLDV